MVFDLLAIANSSAQMSAPITEAFMMQILWAILVILVGGFSFLLWQKIVRLEKHIDDLEAQINIIRTNYLSRFEDVKSHITSEQLKVVKEIAILTTALNIHLEKKG